MLIRICSCNIKMNLVIMLLNGLNCKKYSVAICIVIHSEVLLANKWKNQNVKFV